MTRVDGSTTAFTWKTSVLLANPGAYVITASAMNEDNVLAPVVSVAVTMVQQQAVQPLDRRLMLVETIAISSFLGDYGAGRLLKTFSLLPGEKTTISVQTAIGGAA